MNNMVVLEILLMLKIHVVSITKVKVLVVLRIVKSVVMIIVLFVQVSNILLVMELMLIYKPNALSVMINRIGHLLIQNMLLKQKN